MRQLASLAAVAAMTLTADVALAATYLVSPEATAAGATLSYNSKSFVVGTTAFADFTALMAASPAESSTVLVAPGVYSTPFTVNVAGLKFRGFNAWQDPRVEARTSVSQITARVTVNADNVSFNGFDFTGDGSIYNDAATSSAPLSGFKFIYNKTTNVTVERATGSAFLRLGKPITSSAANDASSQNRYVGVTIEHNIFKGSTMPNHVSIAGGAGTITINDNKFNSGATSVRLDNSTGTINITNNKFMEVGESTKDLGGDFCVQICRCAQNGTTVFNILSNDFRNCVGQKSLYPLIRFFPGEEGEASTVTPVNCTVNIKYNVVRGKTQIHDTYNYFYYANQKTSGDTKTDMRFNTFDRTDYSAAFVNRPDNSELRRYNSSCYDLIKPASSTFGTFQAATTLKAATVLQSFDVDPETGDIYYIQLDNASVQSTMKSTYGDPKSLIITRLKADGTQSKMQLVWAGHGTNMAVGYVNGKLNIFTGGRATLKTDGSETRADACCWFRYVGGAVADLRKTSFTYNGNTYAINTYDWDSRTNEYPAIDEISRLFCSRTTGTSNNVSVNRFQIFDLDEMLADPSTATPLKTVVISKGDNPTSNSADKGYNTWDHQGYTINGDYLYLLEGVGTENTTGINGKSTIVVHIYNWRTNQFVYREIINNSTLLSSVPGEPEGIKVRRNSKGVGEILIGVTSGSSGSRKAVIYKFTPGSTAISQSNATLTPDQASLAFDVEDSATATATVKVTNANLHGQVDATISGPSYSHFSVKLTNDNPWNATTTAKVTYKPVATQADDSGYLRLSTPMSTDVIIPLTGHNTVNTGLEQAVADAGGAIGVEVDAAGQLTAPGAESLAVYNLQGVAVARAAGSTLDASRLSGLHIVEAVDASGRRTVKKIVL